MITKATLSAITLALVLGTAVSGCSDDDSGPTEGPPAASSPPVVTSSPTTPPPSPATSGPSEPSPSPSQSTTSTPDPPKPTVGSIDVLISNSEWDATTGITVRGYANTVDAEATCTLELTKSGVVRTVASDALEGPTTMSCGELTVGAADLSPGDWTAVLSYESATAWGASAPVVVTVP